MLFTEAINAGLVALAHENPGLYLEKAGDFQRQANEAIVVMKHANQEQGHMAVASKDILQFPGKPPSPSSQNLALFGF